MLAILDSRSAQLPRRATGGAPARSRITIKTMQNHLHTHGPGQHAPASGGRSQARRLPRGGAYGDVLARGFRWSTSRSSGRPAQHERRRSLDVGPSGPTGATRLVSALVRTVFVLFERLTRASAGRAGLRGVIYGAVVGASSASSSRPLRDLSRGHDSRPTSTRSSSTTVRTGGTGARDNAPGRVA